MLKIFIFLGIFSFSLMAQAEWGLIKTALVLDAISPPPEKDVLSKEEIMINSIRHQIPSPKGLAKEDYYIFKIDNNINYYYSYFYNLGYKNIQIKGNDLIFNFPGHKQAYIQREKEEESFFNLLGKAMFSLFLVFLLVQIGLVMIKKKLQKILTESNEIFLKNIPNNGIFQTYSKKWNILNNLFSYFHLLI